MLRSFTRPASTSARVLLAAARPAPVAAALPRTLGLRFASHEAESYDDFNDRYQSFFEQAPDLFEVQRGLNNCFAYDLVPTVEVMEAALRAARRCNDFATAVRALEGLRQKVERPAQFELYLKELAPLMEELGIPTKQELYGTQHRGRYYSGPGEAQEVKK
ncbi:cytochrome-c oxidase chain vi precursor [Phaffia rhodozyma]|uniref:Cytochrome c oxidase subunit 6, mitochondrial n=1 Tax=Phaffia rhodozyma TaxID=264483 RepID=A0A0F7SWQ9_PHARH|nr:cytochrome c oxidase subunit 6 [Phaffia rhodozyma]CED85105.1 cytochrome-c oxidase chain vi precursor [Phaffia rhodozyma]